MPHITLILGTLACFMSPVSDDLVVHLRADANARGLQMRLCDIADIDTDNHERMLSAASIVLGAAPAPGEGRILTRATVSALLQHAAPSLRVRLMGAEACRVQADEVRLSSEEVGLLARRAVAQRLGTEALSARISLARAAPVLRSPAGRFNTSFDATLINADPLPARVRVTVRATVDGAPGPAVDVEVFVATEVRVLVAAHTLMTGRALSAADVKLAVLPSAALPQAALAGPEPVLGLLPKGRIEAGRVLQLSDFRRLPVVVRGDPVIVEVINGPLTVRGEGVVQMDGASGEQVQVKTRPGNKMLTAEVIDARTVRVRLSVQENSR
ncbi:MAG: flagellar basal body P-ring formation protein FlgA [Planctomycetes bacterium]|nr:flagellar basal body P-ring formation protein FlgA [Planctomycetota bacterium]